MLIRPRVASARVTLAPVLSARLASLTGMAILIGILTSLSASPDGESDEEQEAKNNAHAPTINIMVL